ncbi:MAG TPA: ABC transporter ATP-binding protein [Desulfobacteria bacterium]|nr:ABC transporter ATP-binding protein [Desulfobacteria bacterium]
MAAIECRHVYKKYGNVQALRDVNFEVRSRICLGFLGPNGAGKTTAIRILAGLARPTGGEISVAGVDVIRNPQRVKPLIGYLAQTPAFYNWMTAEEYLMFCAELFKLNYKEAKLRSAELLERTGLTGAARRKIGGFSGGMKQRLGIAQALINRPKVVFLDEPVSALDPIGRHEVLEIIRELKRETTVFFSTHVLNDADIICDEVIILKEGKVLAQAPIEELRGKYAAPVFELDLDVFPPQLLEKLGQAAWYSSHQVAGSLLTVVVNNVAEAKVELPRLLVAEGAELRRYQVQTPNLEQVFLQVVGGK